MDFSSRHTSWRLQMRRMWLITTSCWPMPGVQRYEQTSACDSSVPDTVLVCQEGDTACPMTLCNLQTMLLELRHPKIPSLRQAGPPQPACAPFDQQRPAPSAPQGQVGHLCTSDSLWSTGLCTPLSTISTPTDITWQIELSVPSAHPLTLSGKLDFLLILN